MRIAESGINELQKAVDTLLIIPNQNLFRVANEKTTFADAFAMADQVLYSGVACITDLMVKEGLINLDFADVRAVMREMGKAMMGTGEASGEKRALRSAEAAISNPLIDDVSMKGARGLLVSITGGNDLTLYEVDEAATRIREEVDSDANIIVGATFDESLEGIIRVSVVATGIDMAGQPHAADTRLAELAQKLRVPPQRITQPATTERAQPQRQEPHEHLPGGLPQAATIEDVTIRPMPPKPTLFATEPADEHQQDSHDGRAFIPPPAERPQGRGARMPRIDELPMPAQNEIRARQQGQEEAAPEKRRRSLLQRLASVGLGRREEAHEEEPEISPRPAARRAAAPMPPMMPPAPRAQERVPDAVSEYGRRPQGGRQAPQGLDQHGRPTAMPSPMDDDQLEIPAFLRRQAN
jgi:cell division protein FtsZ